MMMMNYYCGYRVVGWELVVGGVIVVVLVVLVFERFVFASYSYGGVWLR